MFSELQEHIRLHLLAHLLDLRHIPDPGRRGSADLTDESVDDGLHSGLEVRAFLGDELAVAGVDGVRFVFVAAEEVVQGGGAGVEDGGDAVCGRDIGDGVRGGTKIALWACCGARWGG